MTPYGNVAMGGCCPQCGAYVGPAQGFVGGPPGPAQMMGPTGAGTWGMRGYGSMMGPGWGAWPPGYGYALGWPWLGPVGLGWGLGGGRRWGGTYSPQFLVSGLPTDEEIEEMVYDAIDADPLVPFDVDVNVESDAGTVTLTGTVPTKEIKHAIGDDAWWIPGVDDVRNEIQVVGRRRPAAAAEAPEEQPQPTRAAGGARMRASAG
ncbi:MAG TPA: BON domain-containing protein [Chloroflexota bacterium]|nr:BON domain-containing protein [Chloroflexota bacterium]